MRRLNSDARIIKELSHALPAHAACGPYYLHQMDVAEGLRAPAHAHRQGRGDPRAAARAHHRARRAAPRGGPARAAAGKVTLQPDYVVERGERETVFRNYKGERYAYPEPEETDCSCPYDEVWQARSRGRRAGRVDFPAPSSRTARPRRERAPLGGSGVAAFVHGRRLSRPLRGRQALRSLVDVDASSAPSSRLQLHRVLVAEALLDGDLLRRPAFFSLGRPSPALALLLEPLLLGLGGARVSSGPSAPS